MSFKIKRLIALNLAIVMITLNTSCQSTEDTINEVTIQDTSYMTTSNETTPITTTIDVTEEVTTENLTEVTTTGFEYSSLVELYDKDSFSDEMKSIDWNESLVFHDTDSATQYLIDCTANFQEMIGIIIPESVEPPESSYYKSVGLDVRGIVYNKGTLTDDTNTADFIVYKPNYSVGALVYNAYINNDTSKLSDKYLEVYNVAKDFIENTLDKSQPTIVQEKQIFDYICSITEYYNDESIPEDEYSNFKSAIGVLLEGRANCMGYSDTFYMLCSMAGIDVKYISESNMTHGWNLVTLDGKDYLVDVTFADTSLEDVPNYLYFNAGLDFVSQEYNLSETNPTNDIVKTSDENYYFYSPNFDSHYSNANDIYDTIISLALKDRNNIQILCTEPIPQNDEFINNLRDKLPSELNGTINYLTLPYDTFTYIIISFE